VHIMLYFVSGLFVTGSGVAGLMYCRPRNGQVHPLALKPGLDFIIPIGIVTALALGIGLIVSGVMVG
jgi:hypothetical protein